VIRIVVDEKTSEQLRRSNDTVFVCDASGRILGQFVPEEIDPELLEPQISEEELDRREREGGGRPLADILKDLEARQ
jgi:hypothetical protein